MTNTRAIEMFIKPNFKYFLIPFGYPWVRSTYTFNSLREAKAYAEKLWLEKKERYAIFNVYYRDEESDFGGGWRSKRIFRLNKKDCSWNHDLDNYDIHTAFLFGYDKHTISQWDSRNWHKLWILEIERNDFDDLSESEVRELLRQETA